MQAVVRTLRCSRPSLFQSPLFPTPLERSLWFSFTNSASQLQALSSLTDRKADDEGSGEGEGGDEDTVEVREEDDQFSLPVGRIDGSSNACKLKLTTNHHNLVSFFVIISSLCLLVFFELTSSVALNFVYSSSRLRV